MVVIQTTMDFILFTFGLYIFFDLSDSKISEKSREK